MPWNMSSIYWEGVCLTTSQDLFDQISYWNSVGGFFLRWVVGSSFLALSCPTPDGQKRAGNCPVPEACPVLLIYHTSIRIIPVYLHTYIYIYVCTVHTVMRNRWYPGSSKLYGVRGSLRVIRRGLSELAVVPFQTGKRQGMDATRRGGEENTNLEELGILAPEIQTTGDWHSHRGLWNTCFQTQFPHNHIPQWEWVQSSRSVELA